MSALVSWCVRVLLLLALAGPHLMAANIKVSPSGSFPTVQAGVDAAGPGDVVSVAGGVYRGVVHIPAGKNGLKLIAQGRVVLDARIAEDGLGPAIIIQSDDVLVQGFIVQHAEVTPAPLPNNLPSFGHGIASLAHGTRVVRCTFLHCTGTAVIIEGDDALIERCTVTACGPGFDIEGERAVVRGNNLRAVDGEGILVEGAQAQLLQNTVQHSGGSGVILIAGDGAVVQRNSIRQSLGGMALGGNGMLVERNAVMAVQGSGLGCTGDDIVINQNLVDSCTDDGILAQGNRIRMTANRILDAGEDGFDCFGDDIVLQRNSVDGVDGHGVLMDLADDVTVTDNRIQRAELGGVTITGSGAVIDRNRIEAVAQDAIAISGNAPSITRNTIRAVGYDGGGIALSNATFGTLAHNRIQDVGSEGIYLGPNVSGVSVTKNQITNVNGSRRSGILVDGSGNTVEANKVQGASQDGILLKGPSNLVLDNTVLNNAEDGIDVEFGEFNVVRGNKVFGNLAEGLENNTSNTLFENNIAKGNRTDLANDGNLTALGNITGDGSDGSTAPQIDT